MNENWKNLSEEAKYVAWSLYYTSTPKTEPLEYVEFCEFMETGTPPEGIEIDA